MSIQDYAIKGEVFYLKDVFSSMFQYSIPDYQRPYSWEEEHIKQLFDDLYEFYQRKTDESYFLGSIVVIKKDHQPQADVVDGQQRLTSLTILFATLANSLNEQVYFFVTSLLEIKYKSDFFEGGIFFSLLLFLIAVIVSIRFSTSVSSSINIFFSLYTGKFALISFPTELGIKE